jgi:hypothetical protein
MKSLVFHSWHTTPRAILSNGLTGHVPRAPCLKGAPKQWMIKFFYRIMFHYEIMPASACVIVNYQS